MPDEHARLGPSSAERWLACPGSVLLSERVEAEQGRTSNRYAEEGTTAHELAELTGRYIYHHKDHHRYQTELEDWQTMHPELQEDDIAAMKRHVDDYFLVVGQHLKRRPYSSVLFEQRVHPDIDGVWGTADVVIVSPTHVEVIDFKYGAGVRVSAHDNPQLKLYGLGALEEFGILGEEDTVYMTVFQPRIGDGHASTFEMTPDELRQWRDEVVAPTAEVALKPAAPFNPGEVQCRWCPAAGDCRARMEKATSEDFGSDPDLMDNEELADILTRIPEIRAWCSAVEDLALAKVYSQGQQIPGWKVVRSGGRRKVVDDEAAIQRLVEAGFDEDQVSRHQIQTLGKLEKIVGKDKLPEILGELLQKPEGNPSLAPEDDGRPSIDPDGEAAKEFGDG